MSLRPGRNPPAASEPCRMTDRVAPPATPAHPPASVSAAVRVTPAPADDATDCSRSSRPRRRRECCPPDSAGRRSSSALPVAEERVPDGGRELLTSARAGTRVVTVLVPVVGAVADERRAAAGNAHPPGVLLLVDVDAKGAAVTLTASGLHDRR